MSEKSAEWGEKVYTALKNSGFRVEIDRRNEKIGYMIREAQMIERVPYSVIIGAKEMENGTVSVRNRDTNETSVYTLDEFIAMLSNQVKNRI